MTDDKELHEILMDFAMGVAKADEETRSWIWPNQEAFNKRMTSVLSRTKDAILRREERIRLEELRKVSLRPVTTMTVRDLDADPTGNTSYEEEFYAMPKKWVDAQIRQQEEAK
jgi:hypothetical protein